MRKINKVSLLLILVSVMVANVIFLLGGFVKNKTKIASEPQQKAPVQSKEISAYQVDQIYKTNTYEFLLYKRSTMENTIQQGLYNKAGILYRNINSNIGWDLFFEVKDTTSDANNNPYYIWSEGSNFYIIIVDTKGAGSGEGIAKVIKTSDLGKSWNLQNCFYYIPEYFVKTNEPLKDLTIFKINSILANYPKEYRFNPEEKDCKNFEF